MLKPAGSRCNLDFYRKALAWQARYADGKTIHNTIQTNWLPGP